MFDVNENSGLVTVMQIHSICSLMQSLTVGPGDSKEAFGGFQEASWKTRNILPCLFSWTKCIAFLVTGFITECKCDDNQMGV